MATVQRGKGTDVVVTRRRFTVDEYDRMAAAGILHEDDRVELIDGDILQMCAIGSRHAGCVDFLSGWFNQQLAGKVIIRIQNPVRLSTFGEPEPDVMLLRPRADYYRRAHPTAADLLLVIEVADTSLEIDRRIKLPLYAAAGVPEVWIVDLIHDRVEVYCEPRESGYVRHDTHERAAAVSPSAFPDLTLGCAEILG
ncbi:MAG: Uma2 family endonuclease [Chloroflexi bacterium]|nr:Uma2 family endonuclease [Chloroflexota bacterium]